LLKFFRINHRDEQIGKQREGDEADNNVFHKSLEFFAPVGVKSAGHKKQRDDGDENKINHRLFHLTAIWGSRLNILECGGRAQRRHRFLTAGRASKAAWRFASRRSPKSERHFVCSFGNPGCCGWDTRAPFHLPVELNRARSCPHHDATPPKRLIKRWVVGVKKVLRNDLSKKTLYLLDTGISLKMQRD
jgi:hypothetical protein